MALDRRSDRSHAPERLSQTYIESDYFLNAMDIDSSVIYGRRGSGKTHTLAYLAEKVRERGDLPIIIDMRVLSSNAGIYNDPALPLSTRATRVIVDLIETWHEAILDFALSGESGLDNDLSVLGPALDELADAATQFYVHGDTETSGERQVDHSVKQTKESTFEAAANKLAAGYKATKETALNQVARVARKQTGRELNYLHFGSLDRAVRTLCSALGTRRTWLLIDEWSDGIPFDVQPVVADVLRRCMINNASITVKLMAIEYRSTFMVDQKGGSYIGLELGADTTEPVSIDDSLVIRRDPSDSARFLTSMLYRHYRVIAELSGASLPNSEPDFVEMAFIGDAIQVLAQASEGNPRDAINIVSAAARMADTSRIGARHIIEAARSYFWSAKYKNIEGNRKLETLFHEIRDHSLRRGKRSFLVPRDSKRRPLFDHLYDRRLIHLIGSHVRPSMGDFSMYDAYVIDFGAYADRVLSGTLRWSNDGWVSARSFYDSELTEWTSSVIGRPPRSA